MTSSVYDFSGVAPAAHGEESTWFEYCRDHRLMIQHCASCDQYQFPPRSICASCLAESPQWVEAAGTGIVFTYTNQYREPPGFKGQVPYTIAMIELEEGPRLMSRVVDAKHIKIGMPVEIRWATIAEGTDVPVFVPIGTDSL